MNSPFLVNRIISDGMAYLTGLRGNAHHREGTTARSYEGDVLAPNQANARMFGLLA
jgi:hypothetical protein